MEQFANFDTFPIDRPDAAMAFAIAVGALYCFLGYRLFRLVLFLTGFVLGGSVAAGLLHLLSQGHTVASLVAGVLGGVAGAMALLFVYRAGVFFVGVIGGVIVGMHILVGRTEGWELWAILGAGLGAGLLALMLERSVMSIATAAIGAWAVAMGLAYFLFARGFVPTPDDLFPVGRARQYFLVVWAVFAVAGVYFQLSSLRKTPRAERSVRVT